MSVEEGAPQDDALAEIVIDEFHRHEVLHVASIISAMFEEHIEQHVFTRSDPELAAVAEDLVDRLNDFYQLVGNRMDTELAPQPPPSSRP